MPLKKNGRKQSVDAAVRAIVAETLLVDHDLVTPGTRFHEDLQTDSIDFIEVTMCIEERFGIEITECAAAKCLCVSDLEKLVEKLLVVAA